MPQRIWSRKKFLHSLGRVGQAVLWFGFEIDTLYIEDNDPINSYHLNTIADREKIRRLILSFQ